MASSLRIVLATYGSFGDLNPYLSLSSALLRRGHRPVIAAPDRYRSVVEGAGVGFAPVRPPADLGDREVMARATNRRTGNEYVVRQLLMPAVRESCQDLSAAASGADLLVTHPLAFAGPLVAARGGIRWLSSVLSPISLLSACDPPLFPTARERGEAFRMRPRGGRLLGALARAASRAWSDPVYKLREELGLPRGGDPLYEEQFSPLGTLALFSRLFSAPQPDWPVRTTASGFLFWDQPAEEADGALRRFLESGPPPIGFAMGTSTVMAPGRFFEESLRAVLAAGARGVFVTGGSGWRAPGDLGDRILCHPTVPYSRLFPHCAAVVHPGGIGTMAQVMRAGIPMLVVPYFFDQPDNAVRAARLGVARVLPAESYSGERAAPLLAALLEDRETALRARELARHIDGEDAEGAACDAVEQAAGLSPASP